MQWQCAQKGQAKTNYLKAFNGPKNSIEPFRPIMLEL